MIALLSLILALLTQEVAAVPVAVFATWTDDPTSSVTVDWHLEAGIDIPTLQFRGPGFAEWTELPGRSFPFPHSTRSVRRAQLTGLQPDATYEIRIGDAPMFRYRTMPAALTRPVVFATGGDTQADDARFGVTNRVVAARDVDFVLIGGDLAYSNGDPRLVRREEQWFETASATLRTRDGRILPVISAIGNHEVFSNRDTSEANRQMMAETKVRLGDATYFSVLHARADSTNNVRSYRAVDVGRYLSLVLLDTDHVAPVIGEQTEWLHRALAQRADVPFVFPVYHVPGYPSVRAFSGTTSARVREHWAPAFEAAKVRVAFENHDHAYKRSHPLRAGQRDTSGVIYMGDGAWGSAVRALGRDQESETPWYLARAESLTHAMIVTLDDRTAQIEVVGADGQTIDRLSVAKRSAP